MVNLMASICIFWQNVFFVFFFFGGGGGGGGGAFAHGVGDSSVFRSMTLIQVNDKVCAGHTPVSVDARY